MLLLQGDGESEKQPLTAKLVYVFKLILKDLQLNFQKSMDFACL